MNPLLWSARLWSAFSIVFILYFVGAHVISPLSLVNVTSKDLIAFFFFPIGVFTGLLASWKDPLLGGAITISSLIILFTLNPNTASSFWINVLAGPGYLFLIYGIIEKFSK